MGSFLLLSKPVSGINPTECGGANLASLFHSVPSSFEVNSKLTYKQILNISFLVKDEDIAIDRLTWGSSPYGPDAPRPYRWALCAPQSDINSGEPCSFTKVPDSSQT